jgi:NAD+ diphosphatase
MSHLGQSHLNLFSSATIDRTARTVGDVDKLTALANSEDARFLPVYNTKVLVLNKAGRATAAAIGKSELSSRFSCTTPPVYLGSKNDLHYFAIGVKAADEDVEKFVDLRQSAALLNDNDAALLGYALAILTWQRNHQHCGVCGAPTAIQHGGHVLHCTAPACAREHYPRTDPAIIVLVEHGDRALFGRKPEWPAHRYSTIAGFVEPGESVEQAVVREVFEETGVEVIESRYHSSQPWPFPGTLMLGYTAKARRHSQIHLNDQELEEAKWLSRQELTDGLVCGEFQPPTPISISFRLIEHWFNRQSDVPFRVWCENNTSKN